MKRKTFLSIALSIVTLIASAQVGSGQWKIHPYFVVDNIVNSIDAGTRVYYLSSGSLFYYDKVTQYSGPIDALGDINGNNVKQIYYSIDKGLLFIAYDDCNIDVIDQQGKVYNISAIKDVVLPKSKVINDITFGNGKAYIATSFGYIVIDQDTFRVTEVRNYSTDLASVAIVGGYKVISYSNKFFYSGADEQIEKITSHKQTSNSAEKGRIFPIDDNHFFLLSANNLYRVIMTEAGDGTLTFSPTQMQGEIPTTIQRYPSGFVASNYYYYASGNYNVKYKVFRDYYYTFDANGNSQVKHDGAGVYSSQENGNWWVISSEGLNHIVNGASNVVAEPDGITIKARAYWTTYDPYQQRVLLCRTSENFVLEEYDALTGTEVNSWDENKWRDITPFNPNGDFGGNYWIVVSPNEPNTYFFSYRKLGGVATVQNDTVVATYTVDNSPTIDRALALRFDSKGNLWMPQTRSSTADVVAITPQNQLQHNVNPSMFVTNSLGGACYLGDNGAFKRISFAIGAGDTKVFSAGNYNDPLIIWTNNDDLSLKQYKVFNSFNDQDNKLFTTYGWVNSTADNNGMIWMSTVRGVITFDPRNVFDSDFRITRPKVTKSEGASVNEFLLDGIQVNCISCDEQNRKWIATNTAGVYLVSADGTEIIKHFDSNNSVMPTDQVYSVCCNRSNNSVMIVTAKGVVEYYNDITPTAADYSNVYAYPNPVQSTFTGYVTIKGLMENSNVVITDAAGTQVTTLTSTGGVALWDVCNSSGVPVKTGVYKVYASQGTPSTTGKPLTKITVIK